MELQRKRRRVAASFPRDQTAAQSARCSA